MNSYQIIQNQTQAQINQLSTNMQQAEQKHPMIEVQRKFFIFFNHTASYT
jgi:hypothetical protein